MKKNAIRLKTYNNQTLNNGEFRQVVVLDQYGREMKFNPKTKDHEPTGFCGCANH